jgi:large subunit ribosomal protein L21
MFAVIKTGGKQYKVQEGEILQVEKLNIEKDKKVKFNEVLLIEDGDKAQIGTPFVKNAVVEAVVVENFKDKKVIVFKKKRRKQYRKTRGHRQELTKIKIEEIVFAGKQAPTKAAPKKKAAAKKTIEPAKETAANKPAAKKTLSSSGKAKKPAKKAVATKAKTTTKTPAKKKVVTKTEKPTPVKE